MTSQGERHPSPPERAADPRQAGDPEALRVPRERLLHDWSAAGRRASAYLEALGFESESAGGLARRAVERAVSRESWSPGSGATAETLRALRELLVGAEPGAPDLDERFVAWRLAALRAAGSGPLREGTFGADAPRPRPEGSDLLGSVPPLARGDVVPHRIERRGLRQRIVPVGRGTPPATAAETRARRRKLPWTRVARRRRLLLVSLVVLPSLVAMGFMTNVLPHQGETPLEWAIIGVFGALFGWISIGFWTAMLGFLLRVLGQDRFAITSSAPLDAPIDPGARTAVVMPICDEPVDRVFAGLRAIHRSLERAGGLTHFDFFVLSDTQEPDPAVREEEAWYAWCRDEAGFGRVFYRRRGARVGRKSGNVGDFLRRWGSAYRYMIVLDADSVMSGPCLLSLVRLMEANPDAGVVQTSPVSVGRRSPFARMQQFASRVYGPLFAAGLHYWQLGDGQYWGHNAILRVAPFMNHCGLPRLPGGPPLGGEILSHDFVEAALMGRAGFSLWLAYDLPGSYEETPSSLLEEMRRDRRWCQGNLQHLQLLATEGFFGAHRALFLNGALSYVSALLWFAFLLLGTSEAVWEALRPPDYFPSGRALFPVWPVWNLDWAISLVAVTATILFLPKILGILFVAFGEGARGFGGVLRLVGSALLEVLASTLFAPIRMVFHTRFVFLNLLGRTVGWRSQQRDDSQTTWRDALRSHGLDTLVASAWGLGVYWLNPYYFFWLTPIVAALILSVPLSVVVSRVGLGDRLRRLGLFAIPEETRPPQELRDLAEGFERGVRRRLGRSGHPDGFVRAVVDPAVNALHHALRRGPRNLRDSIGTARRTLAHRAVEQGPAALSRAERRVLLADAARMAELHRAVWSLSDPAAAARWGL